MRPPSAAPHGPPWWIMATRPQRCSKGADCPPLAFRLQLDRVDNHGDDCTTTDSNLQHPRQRQQPLGAHLHSCTRQQHNEDRQRLRLHALRAHTVRQEATAPTRTTAATTSSRSHHHQGTAKANVTRLALECSSVAMGPMAPRSRWGAVPPTVHMCSQSERAWRGSTRIGTSWLEKRMHRPPSLARWRL